MDEWVDSADERQDVEELLVEHLPGLRAFVRLRSAGPIRELESSSDLVQSVCREVLQHQERFQHPGPRAFKRWLYLTALRKIRNRAQHWNAAKREGERTALRAEAGEAALLQSYASVATASRDAAAREELARIEAAFDHLSDDHREVITCARMLGMSHAEIGAQMGRSEQATRQLLARAMARLTALLGAEGA